jgi:nitrogenase subunit NifH
MEFGHVDRCVGTRSPSRGFWCAQRGVVVAMMDSFVLQYET